MKKVILILTALILFVSHDIVFAQTIGERVNGYILLQVEKNGEAWYVKDQKRFYMPDGGSAYAIMRTLSLGITDQDLHTIPIANSVEEINRSSSFCRSYPLANRVKGKILLQVEQHGEAWYVDPDTCLRIYMKDGVTAYTIMRYLSLGITNADLEKIAIGEDLSFFVEKINSYKITPSSNESLGIEWTYSDDKLPFSEFYKEKPGPMVTVAKDNAQVLLPAGYENLGKAYIEDLLHCEPLLSKTLGINFYPKILKLKTFESEDNLYKSFASNGIIFYQRGDLSRDLQDLEDDATGGFLDDRNNNYCANSHELTHAYFPTAPFPAWAQEGLAQYMQYLHQGNVVRANIVCEPSGYIKDGNQKLTYSNLSPGATIDYDTSMCMWKEIDETYGRPGLQSVMQRLNEFQSNPKLFSTLGGTDTSVFVEHVLIETLGDNITNILEKYGIIENEWKKQ